MTRAQQIKLLTNHGCIVMERAPGTWTIESPEDDTENEFFLIGGDDAFDLALSIINYEDDL